MKTPDMHFASPQRVSLIAVELENRHDTVTDGYHVIDHPFYGWVTAQVFDVHGEIIPTPGSSRAWRQQPGGTGRVLVDVLSAGRYPVTVVITGCPVWSP